MSVTDFFVIGAALVGTIVFLLYVYGRYVEARQVEGGMANFLHMGARLARRLAGRPAGQRARPLDAMCAGLWLVSLHSSHAARFAFVIGFLLGTKVLYEVCEPRRTGTASAKRPALRDDAQMVRVKTTLLAQRWGEMVLEVHRY
jgi:hypothetical protein